MTVVPDHAALCDCWAKASAQEREVAYVGRNRGMFAPKGLPDCERCHGAGFWVSDSGVEATAARALQKLERIRARALDAEPSELRGFVLGITSHRQPSERA